MHGRILGGGFLWRFLPWLLHGPWRATTKIEPMHEIHEVREPRGRAVGAGLSVPALDVLFVLHPDLALVGALLGYLSPVD